MEQEEIIKLAAEAGFKWPDICETTIEQRLERFANLVAAAERELISAEFDRRSVYSDGTPSSGWYEPHEPAEIVRNMK